jgi:hypothetical protein
MQLNSNKTSFFSSQLSILGYIVDKNGISPSPAKISKIWVSPDVKIRLMCALL